MKESKTIHQMEKLREKAIRYDGTFHTDTYENGVRQTIDWLLGDTDHSPMKNAKACRKAQLKEQRP